MNDNELKSLWQQQPLREPPSAACLFSAMQNQTSQLRNTLLSRDIREIVACAVVIIVFAVFYFNESAPISRLGHLIVIGSTIFIAWKLSHTRRTTRPAPPGATVVESLRAELNSVRAQSRLLGSVLWWYLLPGFIGLLVATWGASIHLSAKIGATVVFLAVDALIYWVNRQARARQLLPLETKLESLLHSAETGEPLDETHLASLRPIVLSMATAETVKPVEFKVAFWQIAVFGMPGIVGIWFFWMLSRPVESPASKARESSALAVHVEQTNRYSAVALAFVDRFNAGDYAGVQRMYNADMIKAFPPQETTAFYTRLAKNSGRIQKVEGPTGDGYRGWTAFRLHFRDRETTMSMALDAEDKISGIYFQPAHKPLGEIKSFVPRIVSWQRLIWIVPFILGGLLYSRVMQKTTERAVGISALGVHLCKGQTLVLWDEIKEVRPFRFLHVRNLWLIRVTGEKTLMHWTPLERHSDLRTAVEKFAPANHPVRTYLPLLKRA